LRSLGWVLGQHLGEKLLELRPIFVKFYGANVVFHFPGYHKVFVIEALFLCVHIFLVLDLALSSDLFMLEITEKEGAREHVSIEGILLALVGIRTLQKVCTRYKQRVVKLNLTIRYVLSDTKVNEGHLVGVTVQHPVLEVQVTVNDILGVDVG